MSEPLSIIEDLLSFPPKSGQTHVIAIDGRAGSGKTTFADNLGLYLSRKRKIEILHLDEIYSGWDTALGENLTLTLNSIISTLRECKSPTLDIYNWGSSAFDSKRTIPTCDVLIIEGVGSAQRIVRDVSTVSIWLEIDPRIGLERVLARDGREIEAQMSAWQISEEKHFISESTKENVDFVFSTA